MITPYGSQTVTWGVPGQADNAAPSGGGYVGGGRFGGIPWGRNGFNGGGNASNGDQPTITQTLSPGQQRIFDLNQNLQTGLMETSNDQLGRVDEAMSTPWDTSGASSVTPYGEMDNSNQVSQALRDRYMPDIQERRQQGMDDLLIQGHTRGGNAWDTQSRDFDRTENDFALSTIVQAEAEKRANNAQQFGMETADRGRAIEEQAYNRNVPLNEANSLRTGNQIQPYQYQGYQGNNAQAAPLFDATLAGGNFAQQNYQNQVGAYSGFMSGLGQLAGAGIAASDRRLKRNIRRIGKVGSYPVYSYSYIWDNIRRIGVMADDVLKINPKAVIEKDGFLMVDYARI